MNIQSAFRERENNFTLIRLLAAMAVLFGHSYDLSHGGGGTDPISFYLINFSGYSLPDVAVDIFFIISGFLVTYSYVKRENLFIFIKARFLRIFPGLIVVVLFCAFVVGPLATSESISNYLSSQSTWSYVKNNFSLVFGVQYDLPGVFRNNPYPNSVNGSLWTLPIELLMYFWVAVLGALSLLKNEKSFNIFFIVICLVYTQSTNNFFITGDTRSAQLGLFFLVGGFFCINRFSIPLNFLALVILSLIVYFTIGMRFSEFVKSLLIAYCLIFIAIHPRFRLPSIDNLGDISYGLYIYAFPVQQLIIHFIPGIKPLKIFFASTILTVILSILSWKMIESPAIKLKDRVIFKYLHKILDGYHV